MNLGQEYNAADLPQGTGSFDPIPAGWYTAEIKSAELKDTKNGTGKYINIRWDVTGPEYAGRVVFDMINIRNASQKAEEIGRQQLGDLMRSSGIGRLQDTDQLIGAVVSIKVSVDSSPGYDPKNVVKGYKAVEGSSAPKMTATPAAATGGGRAPWQK